MIIDGRKLFKSGAAIYFGEFAKLNEISELVSTTENI